MGVEPISLSISLGVALTSTLIAFKGVVDSANLVADIIEKDNGQRILALEFLVEVQKTDVWGRECGVDDGDESFLFHESLATRRMVAGILGELKACTERARTYTTRHGMEATEDSLNSKEAAYLKFPKIAAQDLKDRGTNVKLKHKFRWVGRDKAKFTEVVQHMKSLNADLRDCTRGVETKSLAAALSVSLLPQIRETLNLQVLAQSNSVDPLVKLSAQLKLIQEGSEKSIDPAVIVKPFKSCFKPDARQPGTMGGTRTTGYFQRPNDLDLLSWIEWRNVDSNLSNANRKVISSRIQALSQMLITAAASQAAEFSLPPCQGLLKDDQDDMPNSISERFGFIFSVPNHLTMPTEGPCTLSQLIQGKQNFLPFLNVRFELAYKLASAMSLMHASSWLHKGFRSDNILIFVDETTQKFVLNEPFLTGFDFSRPETQVSLRDRPTDRWDLNLYYHPDIPLHDFTRIHDIYSLGVVLLEIGLWNPCREIITEKMTMNDARNIFLDEETMDNIGFSMGPSYRDAVRVCLTGDFGVQPRDSGSELSRKFFTKVLQKLSHCKA